MKKIISIVVATAMLVSLVAYSALAQLVQTSYEINSTNFTVDNQAGTSNASIKTGGIFDVGTLSSIPRLLSNNNIGKDLDISFNTLLSCSGNDWRMMVMVRDQNVGKATWERSGVKSGYCVFVGNGVIGIKYSDGSDLPSPVTANKSFTDGNIHTIRITCITKTDGVNIDLYLDDLNTPVLSAKDNSANKIDIDGKLTIIGAVNGGLSGTISNFNKNTQVATPELTPSLGTVDFFSSDYSNYIKYGQGAKMANGIISLVPISTSVLTNSRVYLDTVPAKDATYNMTMKITNASNAQGWLGMIMLRDKMPGNASWERSGAETVADSAGYMIFLNTNSISVSYLTNLATNGVALNANEWAVPTNFDWTASHVWNLGVAEINGSTTITVKVDGTTRITAVDTRAKITTAGGFTVVLHGDNAATTAEISALSVDLSDKSTEIDTSTNIDETTGIDETNSEEPTSSSSISNTASPSTGDFSPFVGVFLLLIAGSSILVLKRLKIRKSIQRQ